MGDFEYDIANSPYGYLFLFNDNSADRWTKRPGGGNASVRIHNEMKGTRPRAMGICIGPKAGQKLGFQTIGQASRSVQTDLNKILWQLAMATATDQPYHRIVYNAASADDSDLGTGVFEVPDKLRFKTCSRVAGAATYFLKR